MKRIEIKDLVINILIPVASGTLVGLIFKDYTSSIEEFNRSIVVPPIIFPIIWSVLYILMGVWFYFFGMEASTKQKIYYYALLGVNLLFTPVLFYFKNITFSLVITLILLIGNSYLFITYLKKDKKSYILLTYLIWLVVANILMLDLFIHNVLK